MRKVDVLRSCLFSCIYAATTLSGCAGTSGTSGEDLSSAVHLVTAYDYQLLDSSHRAVSLDLLIASLSSADVVFIGEYHGNQASHLLEARVLAGLHRNNHQMNNSRRATLLSMEMFARDQQGILDRYVAGTVGERYLVDEAPAWKNYTGSYRPLVEYAKRNGIPVIAANAPGDLVRCIGRQGDDYLHKLDDEEKGYIAQQPFADIAGYDERFYRLMGGAEEVPGEHQRQAYLAQITRDNTMAESIDRALAQFPGGQVIHVNGSFHSEGHLGTAGALQRMNPELTIRVITPLHPDELLASEQARAAGKRGDDFYYLLNPLPQEFVDGDYIAKVRKAMFATSREKAKLCK
ncbi:ChaN family lipoprotein [Microbulbifer bruguierae]|uniref:ChaN family lipoprotein n=1 Tax=Microbulbifer bruguierae TaxID=3029061 RepID=A0ABY8NGM3_9GAMM|nr:ChaN family lipoprotein [Microbulbifer bruguierae]WGL17600.1 ChaN family lipoprotein [Microbulbifer bruguierae]